MARRPITRVDGKVVQIPDADEMLLRRVFIRNLHAAGLPRGDIIDTACKEFSIEPGSVDYLLREIRNDLRIEADIYAPENRAAALNRLYRDVSAARGDLGSLRRAAVKNWNAINSMINTVARVERLIAEFEGTLRPVKVEVGFQGMPEALQKALGNMSQEQIDASIVKERERLRDAAALDTTASTVDGANPARSQETAAQGNERGRPALPAPRPTGRVDGPPQEAVRRSRSSDAAAQRERRASEDAHVGARAGAGGISARVIT